MEPQDSDDEQLILRRKGLTTLPIDVSRFGTLRILSASHNSLVDISPVAHMPALEELNVNHNQLTDLTPVIQCTALRVLLASNNHISEIDGLEELPSLCRLSLFQNMLPDLDVLLERLQACQQLQSLDLGGNPCFQDAAHRHVIVKGLPNLTELDGETIANVDRQLAAEFFLCAEEFGFERPGTSHGRPKTAPVKSQSMVGLSVSASGSGFNVPERSSRSQSRPRSSRGSRSTSRARSNSPDPLNEVREAPVVTNDVQDSLLRFRQYVQALQLRLRTTQVDCENLTRQIQQLRQETQEPILGAASLKEKLEKLEAENSSMHGQAEENRKMRAEVEEKELELSQRRQALGLPERPGTGRPGTAAVEAVLAMSEPTTSEAFRSKCRVLKKDLELERERTLQLRAKVCSQILGREVSPPRREF